MIFQHNKCVYAVLLIKSNTKYTPIVRPDDKAIFKYSIYIFLIHF